MSPRMVIEAELPVFLVPLHGAGEHYQVWLSWSPAEPWTLTLEVPTTDQMVEWRFARDLLWAGLGRPVGRGDVQIAPVTDPEDWHFGGVVVSLLDAREGWAHLYFDRGELWEFLQETKPHFPAARDAARAGLDSEITDLIDQYGGVL